MKFLLLILVLKIVIECQSAYSASYYSVYDKIRMFRKKYESINKYSEAGPLKQFLLYHDIRNGINSFLDFKFHSNIKHICSLGLDTVEPKLYFMRSYCTVCFKIGHEK